LIDELSFLVLLGLISRSVPSGSVSLFGLSNLFFACDFSSHIPSGGGKYSIKKIAFSVGLQRF